MPKWTIKPYVLILAMLFVAAFLFGFFVPVPGKMRLLGNLKASLEPYAALSPVKMFLFILFNNSVKTFVVLVLGILFGLLPLIAVATNGYILGVAYLFAAKEFGYRGATQAVLPHGVLEIPAVILAAAYGLWLGVSFARRIRRRNWDGLGDQFRCAIKMYFKVAFPLFIVAAFIETVLISG